MAKEVITKFFDAAVTDETLAEELAVLATENGYEFTAAEFLGLGAARPLSDEDVENIQGRGVVPGWPTFGPGFREPT